MISLIEKLTEIDRSMPPCTYAIMEMETPGKLAGSRKTGAAAAAGETTQEWASAAAG
jgi:hypothetical protein